MYHGGKTHAAPTCGDNLRNGDETDVDCGGPDCPVCANGRKCLTGYDCLSTTCASGTCVP